jgi:protein gp37
MTEHVTIGQGTSAIEWTNMTWNPVTGCTRVSPGCAHCYIERTMPFRMVGRKFERVGTEETTGITLHEERVSQPLRWRHPRMIFVNSLSDLFHEEIPDEFIARVFDTMRLASRHIFQVLTKRPERAADLLPRLYDYSGAYELNGFENDGEPLPNVWIGVSVENARYTWRADVLREIPAAVRFISAEPLLGSLVSVPDWDMGSDAKLGRKPLDLTGLDWLIVGGESGGRFARPMDIQWVRELREAALASRTAFFFKQWGSRGFEGDYLGAGAKSGGRLLDGRTWDEMPR